MRIDYVILALGAAVGAVPLVLFIRHFGRLPMGSGEVWNWIFGL